MGVRTNQIKQLLPLVLLVCVVSYCRSHSIASDPLEDGDADNNNRVMVQCDHHEIPEVVEVNDIAVGHVCPGARPVNGKVCIFDQSKVYDFDLDERKKHKSFPNITECKTALNQSPSTQNTASVRCQADGNKWKLIRTSDNAPVSLATYTGEVCNQLVSSAGDQVVCSYFSGGERLPSGGRPSKGWRPTNIATGHGLGRYAIKDLNTCLAVTEAAQGDVVCTSTGGTGWKVTHIANNSWCGSSSEHQFCLRSSRAVRDGDLACSYPAAGMGHGNAWVRTRIFDCRYGSGRTSLDECVAN